MTTSTKRKLDIIVPITLIAAVIGWKSWGEGTYNHYFVYRPVGFRYLANPFDLTSEGIYLGSIDKGRDWVSFYLFGLRDTTEPADKWCAYVEMTIKGDIISDLPKIADAVFADNGGGSVVIFPSKKKAYIAVFGHLPEDNPLGDSGLKDKPWTPPPDPRRKLRPSRSALPGS
jgi:hypothetical protein